jgi:hypothetical protein
METMGLIFDRANSALDVNNSPNPDLIEQGKNVGVVHSKTSIGCAGADRPRPVCSMDAIGPVAEDQDRHAQRIVWPGFYEGGKPGIVFSDVWRWRPRGIANFSGDPCLARPLAPLPAYSNGEGNNVILAPHVEQLTLPCLNDDAANGMVARRGVFGSSCGRRQGRHSQEEKKKNNSFYNLNAHGRIVLVSKRRSMATFSIAIFVGFLSEEQ